MTRWRKRIVSRPLLRCGSSPGEKFTCTCHWTCELIPNGPDGTDMCPSISCGTLPGSDRHSSTELAPAIMSWWIVTLVLHTPKRQYVSHSKWCAETGAFSCNMNCSQIMGDAPTVICRDTTPFHVDYHGAGRHLPQYEQDQLSAV